MYAIVGKSTFARYQMKDGDKSHTLNSMHQELKYWSHKVYSINTISRRENSRQKKIKKIGLKSTHTHMPSNMWTYQTTQLPQTNAMQAFHPETQQKWTGYTTF